MQALIVVDAQNEFSLEGLRPVPHHAEAVDRIRDRVAEARRARDPIAWIKHYNKPHESRAFVPGTWGAELSSGLGPHPDLRLEKLFEKDVYGAFSGTGLESWLHAIGADRLLLVGFYTHMCVSTTTREALVRGFDVAIDPDGTGACDLNHPLLGHQSAEEVRRCALLHLVHMGATLDHCAQPTGSLTIRNTNTAATWDPSGRSFA